MTVHLPARSPGETFAPLLSTTLLNSGALVSPLAVIPCVSSGFLMSWARGMSTAGGTSALATAPSVGLASTGDFSSKVVESTSAMASTAGLPSPAAGASTAELPRSAPAESAMESGLDAEPPPDTAAFPQLIAPSAADTRTKVRRFFIRVAYPFVVKLHVNFRGD